MTPKQAQAILAKRRANTIPNVLDPSFPIQTDFICHPSKFKALFATRRFGKSYTAGIYLIKEALENPGVSVLYIALTRDSAKKIMWKDVMKPLNRKYKLSIKFNETLLTATLPNGSIIYFMGADSSEDEKDKLLGQKYRLAIIDEAASFTINMRELVYGILKPAMADLNGTIAMIGTPSNFAQGLFFDVTTGNEPGWHLIKADTKDNPYMANRWAEEIAELTLNQPYIVETPKFKQMYLGLWFVDTDKLVYKFHEDRNLYTILPYPGSKGWTFNLSVDTGYEDDNALVLSGYHKNDPNFYVIKTFKKNHMTYDQVDAKVREWMADPAYPISSVTIDAPKQAIESMVMRSPVFYQMTINKNSKVEHIEMLNGDLIQGRIKIHKDCRDLIDEMMSLVWKTDGDKIVLPKKEHSALPNHLCDAFLYGWHKAYNFLSKPAKIAPMPGTPEYIKQQEDLHKQAIIEKLKRDQALKDGGGANTWVKGPDGRDPWHQW